ncbi:hypothetical protein D5F01_LYC08604 [Larimichthys crocea]|uniref:CARD domain-containing protein n=1 Tax=Larimichthys crocea TaxID=215358 RepID=A0A6G0IQF7_LARCR|nr:hypothetical protein D5F01_LYC08604 [Larimichthys crocea]
MAEEQAEIKLLRSQKAKLIEILSTDADFVLQHADSCSLLSRHGYQQVKACRSPSEKVTELLDHILQRGPEAVTGLLKLLNSEPLQETFPMLSFIKDLEVHTVSSGEKETFPVPETMPSKDICNNGYRLVTEKQLMTLARTIGKTWREIGRMALDIPLCEAGTV